MDRGACWAKVHRVPENHTWLSYWAHVKLNYFIIDYYKPTFSQHKSIKYLKFTPAKFPITESWKLRAVARWVKLSLRLLWTKSPLLPPASLCCCEASWGGKVGGEKEESLPDLIPACTTEYTKWLIHSLSLKSEMMAFFREENWGSKNSGDYKPVFMFGFPRADAETRSWLRVDYFTENLCRNGEGTQGREALMKGTLWSQLSPRSTGAHWSSIQGWNSGFTVLSHLRDMAVGISFINLCQPLLKIYSQRGSFLPLLVCQKPGKSVPFSTLEKIVFQRNAHTVVWSQWVPTEAVRPKR